jgi:DNA processing protein
MTHDDSRDLLIALSLLPFLTPARTRLLVERFDPIGSVLDASTPDLQGLLRLPPADAGQVKNPLTPAMLERVAALRESVVTRLDPGYPPLLREIVDPPLVLHLRGDVALLSKPMIAVVGSRRASPYAMGAAAHLAAGLAKAGLAVVSGMARGIDAAAHRAALDSGGGTIAVLGTGIDVVYPRSNAALFERTAQSGAIVSEFPPGSPPTPEHFPVRNRIISGLSLGTLIVEATGRSGSLITARMAAEQGREVFAVPGPIFSAGSEGTHRLVQAGAKLVHDVNDILEELPASIGVSPASLPATPVRRPREQETILRLLNAYEPLHVETLAERCGKPSYALAAVLLELELDGAIRALPGNCYIRVPGT